ncbi:hypothetical protein KP509_09G025100 [Ceratopteris richardii]|uniref:Uncharacterized protein n=1 Tax=Ceratopteris richardii TaxID=49495 RepID=A0A8T2U6D2_CERRI|nr:hypothetical protein KP509_09G025100 [Ceratopteris richardii]
MLLHGCQLATVGDQGGSTFWFCKMYITVMAKMNFWRG